MGRLRNQTHERFAKLIALGHLSQHAAYLDAVGPDRAQKLSVHAVSVTASRLLKKDSLRARIDEIRAEDERECRWGRKELLDFYCDALELGAGQLKADDRLCQGCEETIVTHYDGKGKPVRTIKKKRLIMPSKVDCADGLRKMLGWDKKLEAMPDDDISELLIMIRRKSLPEKPVVATELLTDHLHPLPTLPP
jgi:hypothetical protein